ncbi:MAG: hypothetical protein ACREOJ_06390 [Gemmatimonadaceae bacterium]
MSIRMRGIRRSAACALFALAALPVVSRTALAQDQTEEQAHLGVDRIGSYISYTWVDHARNGWDLGADLDVGSVITPRLRVVLGGNFLHAQVDRTDALGNPVPGSFHDLSFKGELRYRVAQFGRVSPFFGGAVGPHFLGSNIPESEPAHHLYQGTKVGWEYFGGTDVAILRQQRFFGYVEVRRILVDNVNRTALRLGAYIHI